MHHLLADAWVAAAVDDAVAPFQDLLPPEELSWMRERLADLLEQDPEANATLAGARPRIVDATEDALAAVVDDPRTSASSVASTRPPTSGANGPADRRFGNR